MKRRLLFSIIFSLLSIVVLTQQPQFSIQALFGPTWYSMEDYYKSESKLNFNYSAGGYLMVNIPVGKNTISIRSGYFYDTKNYVIEYEINDDWLSATLKADRALSYGNVPVLMEFRFNIKDRFYPFVSPGMVFGWVLSAEQERERVDGTIINGFPSRSYVQQKQTSFHICTGMNYRLNRLFLLRLEFFISQQLNQEGDNNVDSFGAFSYGIKAGIQFDIFLPEKLFK
jgi:hypothetical protein